MRLSRSIMAILAAACLAAAGLVASTGTAQAAPSWAPASTALIHPGTMMYTDGAQCTANFVYTDSSGHVYVGYAAHCAGTGESTDTNGCTTDSVPLGTKVDFTNDGNPPGQRGPHRGPRHPALQLVDHRAPARSLRCQHLRLQRPGPGRGRPRRRRRG